MIVAVDRRRKAAGTSEGCGRSQNMHTYTLGMYTLYHISMCTRIYTHILQAHTCTSAYILAPTDTLPYADTFTHEHPVFVFSSLTKCLTETN